MRRFGQLTETEKERQFYLPKPHLMGVRAWSLLTPSLFSAFGFGAFAVLAYSFTEVQQLSAYFRRILVLVGAFSLAVGAEFGTLPAIVEIFRKAGSRGKQKVRIWDWAGLIISLIATLASFLFAFATLLGERTNWSKSFQIWGSIVLGLFAALDCYVNFAEFGLYLSTFDDRMDTWERKYAKWRQDLAEATGWARRSDNPRGAEPRSGVAASTPALTDQEQADWWKAYQEVPNLQVEEPYQLSDRTRAVLDQAYVRFLHEQGRPISEIVSVTDFTLPQILDIIRKECNGTD